MICGVGESASYRVGEGDDPVGADVTGVDPVDAEVAAFTLVEGPLDVGLGAHRDRPGGSGQRRLGHRDVTGQVSHVDGGGRRELQLRDGGRNVDAGGDHVSGGPAGLVVGGGGECGPYLAGGAEQLGVGAGGRVDQLGPAVRGPRPRDLAGVDEGREPLRGGAVDQAGLRGGFGDRLRSWWR